MDHLNPFARVGTLFVFGTMAFSFGTARADDIRMGVAAPTRVDGTLPAGPVTPFTASASLLQNEGIDWCRPEIYTKVSATTGTTEYWVRETAPPPALGDDRKVYHYFDFDLNLGSNLKGDGAKTFDYGPLLEGGVYQFLCYRYRRDFWDANAGFESHTVTLSIPGPQNEDTNLAPPATFQIGRSFIENHTQILPNWEPLAGKLFPGYRFTVGETLADLFGHGSNRFAGSDDDIPETLKFITSSMVFGSGPDPLSVDWLGEQGFSALPDAEIDRIASLQPPVGTILTDLEMTPDRPGNTLHHYWSVNLETDLVLQKYHHFLAKLRELVPSRDVGDYYRSIVWSNAFVEEGQPRPDLQKWKDSLTNPKSRLMPAYRDFVDTDGKTKSLLDTVSLGTIDCYPKLITSTDGRGHALYQIYANVYDTLVMKRALPSIKALWFAWQQSDSNQPGRLFIDTPNGRASTPLRQQMPAWWAKTVAMLGSIVGDGVEFWHDQSPEIDDLTKLSSDIDVNATTWEPATSGAPNPWFTDGNHRYPRVHNYPVTYAKLGEYEVAQLRDIVTQWEFATFRVDGQQRIIPSGDATILDVAQKKAPIVLLLGVPGNRGYFVSYPFGDYRQRYLVSILVDGKYQRVYVNGKWPAIGRFPNPPAAGI